MSILETLPNKKMPYWTSVMIPKFKRIMMKYDIDDYKTLYRKLFEKFGEQYPNKDLNQMIDDYCHNNNLKNYDIQLVVTDKFKTVISQTTGNSVSKVFSFFKNGLGIAFGKVAEAEAIAEFDWKIKANKGLTASGTDINVLINNAVQKLYPVGHILMSTNSAK